MIEWIKRRLIGIAGERADFGFNRKFADTLDQPLARLPIGDQIGDGDPRQAVALREGGDLRSAHHRAVVIHQLGEHADRRQAGEPAKIDASLGMAGAHEHPAFLGDQRKHMARPHEVARAHIAVGERAHGIGTLLRRDAGRQAMADIDRDGKGGTERRIVARHHRIEMQPPRFIVRQGRADDARGMADDERHLFGRAQRSGDEQIALILPIVVVGDDDDLAACESADDGVDALVGVVHVFPISVFPDLK